MYALPLALTVEIGGDFGGDGFAVEMEEAVAAVGQIQPCQVAEQIAVLQGLIAKIILWADEQYGLRKRLQIGDHIVAEDSVEAPCEAVAGLQGVAHGNAAPLRIVTGVIKAVGQIP